MSRNNVHNTCVHLIVVQKIVDRESRSAQIYWNAIKQKVRQQCEEEVKVPKSKEKFRVLCVLRMVEFNVKCVVKIMCVIEIFKLVLQQ